MDIIDRLDPRRGSIHLPRSAGVILGGTFAVLGGLIAVVGIVWLARTALFVSHARQVPGHIVEIEQVRDADGGSFTLPVYTFTDAAGTVHKQRSTSGASGHGFEPGDQVAVYYDVRKPADSRIGALGSIWIGPVVVTLFGLVAAGTTSVFLLAFTGAAPRV